MPLPGLPAVMLQRASLHTAAAAIAVGVVLLAPAAAESRSSSGARAVAGTRVTLAPFRLSFGTPTRTATSQALGKAGPGARMSYGLANGRLHTLTRVARTRRTKAGVVYTVLTDEPGRRARVAVRRTRLGVRVEWTLVPATGVVQVFESFSTRRDEHFLGSGQRPTDVDLRTEVVPLKVDYGCGSTIPMPFFVSSAGYGVYLDTSRIGNLGFARDTPGVPCADRRAACPIAAAPDRTQICVRGNRLSYELYTGTPAQVVSRYTARIGRAPLPSPSQFALIKWRDVVAGPHELLEDVDQLQSRGIPIGWVLLDNPWEVASCLGALSFTGSFGDPKAMIDAIHARGVRFMLWISPYVRRQPGCPATPFADRSLFGPPAAATIDLTDPASVRTFKQKLRPVLALGVDGVKGDRADEVDLEKERLAAGSGAVWHNRYPYLFAQAVTDVLRELRGRDFATIFRAGFVGSQSLLPGVWAGDQVGNFDGLRSVIRMAQNAGVSGFPFWGSDIGGYDSTGLAPDVFIRWAQFGAISPVFEVGGIGANARFWEFGDEVVELFRRSAVLHYELFPYFYELARQASATGVPILRPLGFQYPQDAAAWRSELQLFVGPDLLAAPVADEAPVIDVYLPRGGWVDLYTGATVNGPGTVSRPTTLADFPLYLRQGAAIPFNLRDPDVWAAPWGVNDLNRRGRAGWLYAPGPAKVARKAGAAGTLRASQAGSAVTLELEGAPRETQVLVLVRQRPRGVRIGSAPVPEAASLAVLKQAPSGWIFKEGPFGGIVVKLAPANGRARATVDLG